MTTLKLSAASRRAFDRLAGDCQRVLESRLVAVLSTGPASSAVFASSLGAADLEAFGALVETWHRDGLDTPLLLTPNEFRRSLDTFPLEYQAMMDRHVVIVGSPPFHDAVVPSEQLRRACEVQAKGHLIHLRQAWIDAAGRDDALAAAIVRSAAPLGVLLANVARLHGLQAGDDEHLALAGARKVGLPIALIRDVLALEDAPEHGMKLVRRLPDYLLASEELWTFVDHWSVA